MLKVLDVYSEMVGCVGCAGGGIGLFHKSSISSCYRFKLEWAKSPSGLHLASQ